MTALFLCLNLPDYRTFIGDYLKLLKFVDFKIFVYRYNYYIHKGMYNF